MKELKIGFFSTFTKKITEQDIIKFADITGDQNPIHLDDEYAKNTMFKAKIAHGFHVGGFISAAIAQKLPGEGTIYLSQSMQFKAPVFVNDIITAKIVIIDIPKPDRVLLQTTCSNQQNKIVIEGEAIVIPPKECKILAN